MSSIGVAGSADAVEDIQLQSEREDLYSTVKSNRLSEDLVLVETSRERSIRKACETLAADMIEMIRTSFPAFEGSGINSSWQLDAAKLGIDLDGETPADVKSMALDSVKSPSLLLQSIITHTSRIKTLIHKEMDMIDIRADAELLRVANYCLKLAGEQEKVVTERWLPELRNAVQEAQRCFEDCRRVRGLVDEWYIDTSNLQQQ